VGDKRKLKIISEDITTPKNNFHSIARRAHSLYIRNNEQIQTRYISKDKLLLLAQNWKSNETE
jgi:hypothetical protein